eukprot:CAMPEP_0171938624 /NCGR_PEP_ID=MMETSP0993-20121228/35642_1 /TAXON_ID=483369 /ORGANISM="non described non described, Strain CCMP2098" /LENGTH=58 /DNA_ID=CAMNT_0012580261 /DNA_START=251 /DNA_END=423 /DNA_ORIENTATION=-
MGSIVDLKAAVERNSPKHRISTMGSHEPDMSTPRRFDPLTTCTLTESSLLVLNSARAA